MPELPEVESARAAIERSALDRRIADVDDTDTYVCRPHRPGEIRDALVGRRLTSARRRGKSMWCETSVLDGDGELGPVLGLHLGMAGRIIVTGPDGSVDSGGDPIGRRGAGDPALHRPVWDRFTLVFADGGSLRLFDKRRLGRVRLEPPVERLGPDAREVTAADFRARVGRGRAPVKARLLDQAVLAGVGNLLADEALWQARLSPRARVDTLDAETLTRLHRAVRSATRAAMRKGGVHTGRVIPFRHEGAACPRCGAPMARGVVGSRTTWWCSLEQG